MDALKLENVSKQYKDFKLSSISFTLPAGSIMGLIGENGAGKTTTIKLILDMIHKDAGSIEVLGMDSVKGGEQIKKQIGVVLDEGGFYEAMTPKGINSIMKDMFETWDTPLFKTYLEKFGLTWKKNIKKLSHGMKKKLNIAVALSHHPRLLILDEATSGLDPVVRSEILDMLLDFIQDEQNAVLISSHITSDLEKVADYITFIHDGKIAFSQSKDNVIYGYGVMRLGLGDFEAVEKADIIGYRKSGFGYEILVADRAAAQRKYQNAVVDAASLEDVMLYYVKGENK